MQRYDRAFEEAAQQVDRAASKTMGDFSMRDLPDEPSFTVALVTRMRDNLDGFVKHGIAWHARILSPKREEPEFGADFAAVLRLNLPDYSVTKGFLAQAKRQEPGKPLPPSHWDGLVKQCITMLKNTTESFVFVYARNGVLVVPALSVVACKGNHDLHMLHGRRVKDFYRDHLECWIGQSLASDTCPAPWQTADTPAMPRIVVIGSAE